MFLLRFLYRIVIHPAFFIPSLVLIGSLAAVSDPDYARLVDTHVLKLWTPEAGPRIVSLLIAAVAFIGGGSLAFSVFGWWRKGAPNRADRSAARERAAAELADQIAAGTKRKEEADYRAWAEQQIRPWRVYLRIVGEDSLIPEIEAMFAERKDGEAQSIAERRHATEIMIWLVEKAVVFAAGSVDDVAAVKIHRFVEEAFRIAGEQGGWRRIMDVQGARQVVAPVFAGQAAIYRSQCGDNQAFLDFAIWLATTA